MSPRSCSTHAPRRCRCKEFAAKEGRYSLLARSKPELAERLMNLAQKDVDERWHVYEQLAAVERNVPDDKIAKSADPAENGGAVEEELP